MKTPGSEALYNRFRTEDLLCAYFKVMRESPHISMPEVFRRVCRAEARRFWVSPSRAEVVVTAMKDGCKLSSMRPNKRAMFEEIYRRTMDMQERYPSRTLRQCVEAVLLQPAPGFYLSPGSARLAILKARKEWFSKQKQRLQRLSSQQ